MGTSGRSYVWRRVVWWCTVIALLSTVQAFQNAENKHIYLSTHPTPNHIGVVHEVQEGETATLPCPSNDDDHRFIFWQLPEDIVIGPANEAQSKRYKYEVLAGDLQIKHVAVEDAGHYKCVSKGIREPTYLIQPVTLVVKKDWEIVWESDTTVNLLRGLLAMVVIGVVCGIIFVLFKMRRNGYVRGDDLSDDEGPEEIREGPYHSTTQRATQEDSMSLVDTELPRALNSMYTDRL